MPHFSSSHCGLAKMYRRTSRCCTRRVQRFPFSFHATPICCLLVVGSLHWSDGRPAAHRNRLSHGISDTICLPRTESTLQQPDQPPYAHHVPAFLCFVRAALTFFGQDSEHQVYARRTLPPLTHTPRHLSYSSTSRSPSILHSVTLQHKRVKGAARRQLRRYSNSRSLS